MGEIEGIFEPDLFTVQLDNGIWENKYCMVHDNSIVLYDEEIPLEKFVFCLNNLQMAKISDNNPCNLSLKFVDNGPMISIISKDFETCRKLSESIHFCLRTYRKLSTSCFDFICPIGYGYSSEVVLARDKVTDVCFAIKIIPKARLKTNTSIVRAVSERNALMQASHPFITDFISSFQTNHALYYVLEFIGGGDLFFHLTRGTYFSHYQIRLYVAEITLALLHLHKLGIVYRDLKPENILIGNDGHLKLTDFGLAKEIASSTGTICGTNEYIAPEMLNKEKYGMEVDWWSLGVLVFRLFTGKMPFSSPNLSVLYQSITVGKYRIPKNTDPIISSFIRELLQIDPSCRIGDDSIRTHPFFEGVDWKKIIQKQYKPEFIPNISTPDSVENFLAEVTSKKCSVFDDADPSQTSSLHVNGFSFCGLNIIDEQHAIDA